MDGDDSDEALVRSAFQRIFQASMLLFGAVIALNLTVVFLRPLLPWIVSVIGLVTIGWFAIAFVRWRRSRW